ncbi:hypothetical protein B0H17DRAFT_1207189 [Mycena rosella]|uniref:Uncharacterized protein n=1 Tax=Mycena rosella TaxID=1033263 RepID=A0AAD7D789_MYCRO|nr:hypothetical protein B0H17DRAFT_1207189 [Mycena rosella]
MIGPRTLLLLLAVLCFAFLATAAPIPEEGSAGLVKKALKQYKVKRGEVPTRVARDAAKPSGYGVTKRDAAAGAQPSKSLAAIIIISLPTPSLSIIQGPFRRHRKAISRSPSQPRSFPPPPYS